jgi:hypothetical protein
VRCGRGWWLSSSVRSMPRQNPCVTTFATSRAVLLARLRSTAAAATSSNARCHTAIAWAFSPPRRVGAELLEHQQDRRPSPRCPTATSATVGRGPGLPIPRPAAAGSPTGTHSGQPPQRQRRRTPVAARRSRWGFSSPQRAGTVVLEHQQDRRLSPRAPRRPARQWARARLADSPVATRRSRWFSPSPRRIGAVLLVHQQDRRPSPRCPAATHPRQWPRAGCRVPSPVPGQPGRQWAAAFQERPKPTETSSGTSSL